MPARYIAKKLHVKGPRGVALLGFALLSFCFGLNYWSPFAISVISWPYSQMFEVVPMVIWGFIWYVMAGYLTLSAFKFDQSWALGIFSGLLFLWGATAAYGYVVEMIHWQSSRLWFPAALFFGLSWSCLGVARMVNPPTPELIREVTKTTTESDETDGLA